MNYDPTIPVAYREAKNSCVWGAVPLQLSPDPEKLDETLGRQDRYDNGAVAQKLEMPLRHEPLQRLADRRRGDAIGMGQGPYDKRLARTEGPGYQALFEPKRSQGRGDDNGGAVASLSFILWRLHSNVKIRHSHEAGRHATSGARYRRSAAGRALSAREPQGSVRPR